MIGIKIIMAMVVYVVTPLIELVINPLIVCFKSCYARCQTLQVDMNRALQGPVLDVTKIYSLTLT